MAQSLQNKLDHLHLLIKANPYLELLGAEAEVIEEEVIVSVFGAPHLVGNINLPALHGGVIGSLLGFAATAQVVYTNNLHASPRLVNIDIDYLRTGKPIKTFAAAKVVRQGRRVANMRAELWQAERTRTIAVARVQFLLDQ